MTVLLMKATVKEKVKKIDLADYTGVRGTCIVVSEMRFRQLTENIIRK